MAIELPTQKVKASEVDPLTLIIYSKVKIGKTTALSLLENNLIIDTEGGTKYLDALKVSIKTVEDLLELCKAIKAAGNPYTFITIDTLTALEDIAKPFALKLWKASPMFTTKYNITDITQVPNGAGYLFWKQALEAMIGWVQSVAKYTILVCHSKDSSITESDISIKDIDMTGKVGRVLASRCDSIGYLVRDEDSNTVISFKRSNKQAECESRCKHLADQDIILIENKDGELIPHWERIYTFLNKK